MLLVSQFKAAGRLASTFGCCADCARQLRVELQVITIHCSHGQMRMEHNQEAADILLEYIAINFVNTALSVIFFLSVTALMCFVLDHLL